MTDRNPTASEDSSIERKTAGSAPAIPNVTGDLVDGDGGTIGELEVDTPLPARPTFDAVAVMRALAKFEKRIGGDVNIGLVENQQDHESPVLALWSEDDPGRALLVAPRIDRWEITSESPGDCDSSMVSVHHGGDGDSS